MALLRGQANSQSPAPGAFLPAAPESMLTFERWEAQMPTVMKDLRDGMGEISQCFFCSSSHECAFSCSLPVCLSLPISVSVARPGLSLSEAVLFRVLPVRDVFSHN